MDQSGIPILKSFIFQNIETYAFKKLNLPRNMVLLKIHNFYTIFDQEDRELQIVPGVAPKSLLLLKKHNVYSIIMKLGKNNLH